MTDMESQSRMARMWGNFQFNGKVVIINGDHANNYMDGGDPTATSAQQPQPSPEAAPEAKPAPEAKEAAHEVPAPSRRDLEFLCGDTYPEMMDNVRELGNRLALAMHRLGKTNKRSQEIGQVILEAFNDNIIRYAPKAGAFKRLFDSYMGDATISERSFAEVTEFLRRKRVPLDDM